jgi:hypothetical protein
MWSKASHVLSPLASLTSKQAKWHWGKAGQKGFDDLKQLLLKK